jgi:hypothetical protein
VSEKITFQPNVIETVALKFPDGKTVEGRFGDQMFYTTTDNRAMYLDMDVAAKINMLGVQKGEQFSICKRWSGKKGDPIQWDVWRPEPGQQPRQLAPTPAQATGIEESELEAQIRAEILARTARQVAGASASTPAPVAASLKPPSIESPNGNGSKPNGTNGSNGAPPPNGNGAARPYNASGIPTPPVKIPADVAFREVLAFVTAGLKEAGEQWTDESKQGMVSTIMIQGMRDGVIGTWNRGAK